MKPTRGTSPGSQDSVRPFSDPSTTRSQVHRPPLELLGETAEHVFLSTDFAFEDMKVFDPDGVSSDAYFETYAVNYRAE